MKRGLLLQMALVLAVTAGCERDFGVSRRDDPSSPLVPVIRHNNPEIVHILYGSHQFVIRWSKSWRDDFRSYTLYQSSSPDMAGAAGIYRSENPADTCYAVGGIEKNQTRYYQIECQYADTTKRQESVSVASACDRILVSGYSWSPMGVNSVDINANWMVRIAPNGSLANPSRDGKKIVYCSSANGADFTVETVNADGTGRQVIADSMSWNGFPEFSPDGSKIVYVAYHNKVPCVFTANSDGSDRVRLADVESSSPHFTADGTGVIYVRRIGLGQEYLYRVNADGTNRERIDNHAGPGSLDVSPSGDQIVFNTQVGADFGLASVRPDGSDYRVLVTSPGSIADERFSPDGSQIVYTALTGPISEVADLHIMNADGTGHLVLKSGGNSRFPRFSPDGSRVIFQCYNGMDPGVYIINTDGSGLVRVGGEFWGAEYPVFLPVE